MNNRIQELLQRYLDDRASAAERQELMKLYHEGKLDDAVIEGMMKEIFNERSEQDISPDRAQEMFAHIISHEEEGVIPINRRRSWVWSAAAAILIVGAAGAWWMFGVSTSSPEIAVEIREDKLFTFTDQQNKYRQLPDGSTVVLNQGSELSYRASYGNELREVTLKGEAFFEVKPDPLKPFIVRSGNITTKVLGTAFNVKAYSREAEIIVTVTKGKVQVLGDERELDVLTPDQQIAVNTATRQFRKVEVNAATAIAWTNDLLILDHVSLEKAAEIIADKYNVKIVLANDALKKCRVMATFAQDETLEHVLEVVSTINQTQYTVKEDGSVVLEGKGCN